MKLKIKSIKDIYKIKYLTSTINPSSVTIDGPTLFKKNVLRHALKYALWKIELNSHIKIDLFKDGIKSRADQHMLWAIKKEIFKSLKNEIKCISLSSEQIILEKIQKSTYINSGISIGIVFSGNKSEENQLLDCIKHIQNSFQNFNSSNFEIIICTSSDYDATILKDFNDVPIKILHFDNTIKDNRIMIGSKKNFIYQNSNYNILVLMHTRIHLEKKFLSKIFNMKFDMISPSVFFKNNDYLSYHLYLKNIRKVGIFSILDSSHFGDRYLYFLENRKPYIDGGLIVVNKNIFENKPYSEYVAWDEAEDIEMCESAFQNGHLIDFFPNIKAFSINEKYDTKPGIFKKIFIFFVKILYQK